MSFPALVALVLSVLCTEWDWPISALGFALISCGLSLLQLAHRIRSWGRSGDDET